MEDWKELEDWKEPDDAGQEEPTPVWLWVLAGICWAIAVYVMYTVEHKLYGGIVKTNTLSYAIIPLGILFAKEKQEEKGKAGQVLAKIGAVLVLAMAVVLLLHFWERSELVMLFQIVCLIPLFFLPKRLQKADSAWGLLLCSAVLAIATLVAPRFAGFHSVPEAAELLRAEGYGEVTFQQPVNGRWLDMPENDFTPEELETEVYVFTAEKDGRLWLAAVGPVRCSIAGIAESDGVSWIRE